MQTKALHLFWHKAELRLVEQPAPEAPVFAMSRPSLLGGREEFLLQYPARLEPLTEREIARHRFTVRHGKKRRSFQAPDAATFETWLSALEQALESKPEPEHTPTPSSTSSNATTAVSSQGKTSSPRSTGTYESSRDGRITAGSNVSSQRSNISSHASTARAPPLRLTLERPCFTRDPRNLKLIWLHRPAWTTPSAANANADVAENELDVNISVESEFEELADGATDDIAFGEEAAQEVSDEDEDQDDHNVLSVVAHDEDVDEFLGDDTVDGFTSDDADTSSAGVVSELNDSERDSINVDESYLATSIIATSPVNTSKFEELTGMAPQKDMAIVVVSKSQLVRTVSTMM
ncbi:Pleckstrin homology-like domain [Phytophthora cinnamomi]|uniref:Pleckstrin homology-like domain n=1 Tax=Phytophthora cinnamomi TaxID=4785 RepID=UPI00355A5B35|nr:Pleckstrin homology-like domain [Phytophthora cinnamomi]